MALSTQMIEVLKQLSISTITRPRPGPPGLIAHVWAKYQTDVESMVRTEKIQPIHVATERDPVTELTGLVWWNPAGGWPLPHFHLGDKIYPATDVQWQKFSKAVVAKVGTQLQSPKTQVSFDQLVHITEGMG